MIDLDELDKKIRAMEREMVIPLWVVWTTVDNGDGTFTMTSHNFRTRREQRAFARASRA